MKNPKEADDDDKMSQGEIDETTEALLSQVYSLLDIAAEKMDQLYDLLEDDAFKKKKLDLEVMAEEVSDLLEEMEE